MTDAREHSAKIRILVLDEQPLLRDGISAYLNSQPDMVVCGEVDNIADVQSKIAEYQPQLLVTELRVDACDSLKLVKEQHCACWCTPGLRKAFSPNAPCARARMVT